jgi:hypothetical protein
MTCRKAFEEWVMLTSRRPGTHINRSHTGQYTDNRVMGKWAAWKAAWDARVPEGHCVVPRSPTEPMINDGRAVPCDYEDESEGTVREDYTLVYKAMTEAGEV